MENELPKTKISPALIVGLIPFILILVSLVLSALVLLAPFILLYFVAQFRHKRKLFVLAQKFKTTTTTF